VLVETQLLIELREVEKVHRTGELEYPGLRGVDMTIHASEMAAIIGPSGSGKPWLGG
jgi:putative ABC transport system ATP-binding protein